MEHRLQHYIKYECSNCGWTAQVNAQWKDLKPKICGNPKCKTSFLLHKDKLKVEQPKSAPEAVAAPKKKVTKKKTTRKKKVSKST